MRKCKHKYGPWEKVFSRSFTQERRCEKCQHLEQKRKDSAKRNA